MSSWAGLQPQLRGPVLATGERVVFAGFDETNLDESRTGDPANPFRWILVETSAPSSDYGTFSGAAQRFVYGTLRCSCMVEPLSGERPLWELVESLETQFTGQDTSEITFHIPQAYTLNPPYVDGSWLRLDWELPFLWQKEAS